MNTLAFFEWSAKHIDLVEANKIGISDMKKNFEEYSILKNKYDIFECRIEDYNTTKKYDFIIAEGFLPYIENKKEVIDMIKRLIKSNGVIVITCIDDVCMFIEAIKRLIAVALTKDMYSYDEKLEYLVEFFTPQLSNLKGMSRPVEDWVNDQILNPAGINGNELSIEQAICFYGDDFDVLGSSPNMFVDYSWYKNIWSDYKKDYINQFKKKRYSLLMANMEEVVVSVEQSNELEKSFVKIKKLAAEYEKDFISAHIEEILIEMDIIDKYIISFPKDFKIVFYEMKSALESVKNGKIVIANYPHFFSAFGRTQQYISFVKR